MPNLGYTLSSEEHGPSDLVDHAARAETAGFEFAMISDHYHPWIEQQGESPFVWGPLGAIAHETSELRVGTGVTCPTMRLHPAVLAQAAATAGAMFDGRFFFGVGTGDRLNEHVTAEHWPPHHVRLEMLEEAIGIIRELWTGEMSSHDGNHFTVENARVFTLPETPPDIAVAAGGEHTATVAGRSGDALVSTAPTPAVVETFVDGAGEDAPRYGQVHVCWAETEREARETVHTWWPNSALPGQLGQELPTPTHFEQAVELVGEADAVEHVPCGPDADRYVDAIEEFVNAGFDHVYLHQVGPDQAGFIEFFESEIRPSFA